MKKYKSIIILILTVLSISFLSCREEVVEPKENLFELKADFFPLAVDNWWTFEFIKHDAACFMFDNWEEGTLNWKIIDEVKSDSLTLYIVEETVNGIRMNWPPDGDIDTTYIDRSNKFKIYYKSNGFVKIGHGNHLGSFLGFEFRRYYDTLYNIKYIDSRYSNINVADTNIIHNSNSRHYIRFDKNVGITICNIKNGSNCSPKGSLSLEDYYISN